jgi:UDP-N-acetylmuramate dehydrogenase
VKNVSVCVSDAVRIEPHHIPTWFRIGGGADRFARPGSPTELAECVRIDRDLRVLGDGANLLVDDDGVAELVVSLDSPAFSQWTIDRDSGRVVAGAGAKLQRLIPATVRAGLAGLESLAGVPASIGGAIVMNAGGTYGQIADYVVSVDAIDREGRMHTIPRDAIRFGYRASGLEGLIIVGAEFKLARGEYDTVRDRQLRIMKEKSGSQPLGANSAGCCFKNPTLSADVPDIGARGGRVSAGLVIDRAGLKGLSVGGATVSDRHANFIVTTPDAKARHVISLMSEVRRRVADRFGIELVPEVVIWSRRDAL